MSHMRQEVNLYLPHLRPKIDWLSPSNSLLAVAVAVVMMVLVALLMSQANKGLQTEIAALQQKNKDTRLQIKQLSAKLPKSKARQLDQDIAQLRRQIIQRQRIKSLVEAQNLGNADGFSEQMNGLARRIPSQLYLEGFRLEAGGSLVSLSGKTLKAESVPLYLEHLQQEVSFNSSQFGLLAIERQAGKAPLTFTVAPLASQSDDTNVRAGSASLAAGGKP